LTEGKKLELWKPFCILEPSKVMELIVSAHKAKIVTFFALWPDVKMSLLRCTREGIRAAAGEKNSYF
jgi:hypothetical protein